MVRYPVSYDGAFPICFPCVVVASPLFALPSFLNRMRDSFRVSYFSLSLSLSLLLSAFLFPSRYVPSRYFFSLAVCSLAVFLFPSRYFSLAVLFSPRGIFPRGISLSIPSSVLSIWTGSKVDFDSLWCVHLAIPPCMAFTLPCVCACLCAASLMDVYVYRKSGFACSQACPRKGGRKR